MAYFLGINEINKVKESSLDDNLTCLAQYDVTNNFMREAHFCDSRVTVKNHSIIFQTKRKVHKLLYSGKLPSHNVATELLESHNEIKVSWKNRIKVKVYEKKNTLLSISNNDDDDSMEFDNGKKFIRFDHEFSEIESTYFSDDYIVIATGNFKICEEYNEQEKRPNYLILFKIIERNEQKILMEVCRSNLNERFQNINNVQKLKINKNLPSKLLIIMQTITSYSPVVATFDMNTLQFSSAINLSYTENLLKFFYTYQKILKEMIIVFEHNDLILHIIRESSDHKLYIYKKILLTDMIDKDDTDICDLSICNNRNNEIILFCNTWGKDDTKRSVLVYELVNDRMYRKLCISGRDQLPNVILFFNTTGEEIFLKEENKLNVFVYKSQVRSLKGICQLVVNDQYTNEQLKQLSLPKYIFNK